jgi:hypothetical protein
MLAASGRTQLLVDGDIHSIEQIREAIHFLKAERHKVETTLFAAPRRVENNKWCRFMQEPDVMFEPVLRSDDESSEPNDEAIQIAIQECTVRDDVACIALMTSDTGFIDTLVQLQFAGLSTVVFIPETKYGVLGKYRDANIKVLKLSTPDLSGPRVRAVLDRHGDGSVHLAGPYKSFDNSAAGKRLAQFLKDLGFMGETGYLVQAVAKFWFAHRLGPLTVFPPQLATIAVHDVVQDSSGNWEGYTGSLAFCLPISSTSTITKAGLRTYGSKLARQVFRGGGPFILQDSPDLTAQFLRRLGYLDNDLNDDFPEAVFCFLNAGLNKTKLRLIGALPGSGARSSDVCKNLRAAFLAHDSPGQWQYIRKGKSSMSEICALLRKAKLMDSSEYVQAEVFEAMKMYADQHGLPAMRTFNGRAARILQSVSKNPDSRKLIEINR